MNPEHREWRVFRDVGGKTSGWHIYEVPAGREIAWDIRDKTDAEHVVAMRNAFVRHFTDPVAAAEQDALGQMIEALIAMKEIAENCVATSPVDVIQRSIEKAELLLALTTQIGA